MRVNDSAKRNIYLKFCIYKTFNFLNLNDLKTIYYANFSIFSQRPIGS